MNTEDQATVLRHVQHVARHFSALRCSGEKLIELLRFDIGHAAPEADALSNFLRKEDTQKLLEAEYETALWISCDHVKSWRLICLATPTELQNATARLQLRPPSGDSCSWCWQAERGHIDGILFPELNLRGEPIDSRLLHRACMRPWKLMRNLVERGGV